jgi:DNA invertase Pin-like site-specific DNA recombinase/transposase-like protein
MVYVRQSTLQQTTRNQESTRLQYALVERAVELGFARERIVVIDDDLGRSGKSAEGRPGFQRLVAEVGLSHVGIILGAEVSRLARSCRDFYHLLEVCALFGTLICDQDGIYDPTQYNDRLVLGLKGTWSEAELHILKQRLLQGKLQKARRGELGSMLPIGYVRRPSGEVIKDPDEQVQAAVELIFEQFAVRGTIHSVMRYVVDNGILVPVRCRSGINKGDLEWQRPNRRTLSNLLHNPAYAGAYVYGRRRIDPRKQQAGRPGTGRTVAPREQWEALLMGRLPAYITWEQYEANQEQLARNQARARGTVRNGPAMLTGLLSCGRCGRKMTVAYTRGSTYYGCQAQASNYGGAPCQSLAARVVDERISELVLLALQPSALEVSLRVAQDLQVERVRLEVTWLKQLERAQYEVDRALRQYNTVEPENRLVARTLEKQLEQKLSERKALELEYARVMAQQPTALSESELTAIRALAADIPALWNAPTTTRADRQQIIRQLVDKIVLNIQGHSEKVDIQVQWAGGHRTETTLIRPVGRIEHLSYYSELQQRVQSLQHSGLTAAQIAQRLNDENWRPAKRRETWNDHMVLQLCARLRKPEEPESADASVRPPQTQWTVSELARHLDMPDNTLYAWLCRGWIRGQQRDDPHQTWLIDADPQEVSRLRALRNARRHPRPSHPSTSSTRIRA